MENGWVVRNVCDDSGRDGWDELGKVRCTRELLAVLGVCLGDVTERFEHLHSCVRFHRCSHPPHPVSERGIVCGLADGVRGLCCGPLLCNQRRRPLCHVGVGGPFFSMFPRAQMFQGAALVLSRKELAAHFAPHLSFPHLEVIATHARLGVGTHTFDDGGRPG